MTLSVQKPRSSEADWSRAFSQTAQEFPLTPLKVISGQIPAGLTGSLYRNGPSLFVRNGELISHWFDGDGAVLGVHFAGNSAQGTYRRVQTAGYKAEEESRSFEFGGYGRKPKPFWQRSSGTAKNAANTSVLALDDRLLALWEGGHPHGLDLQTLETFGLDSLQTLSPTQSFSAHPKVDPQTGDIYNFGISFGRQTVLNLYKCDRKGNILRQTQIPLQGTPLIHDFVMAGGYLVFFIPPVYMDVLPVLLRWKSFGDAMRWRPERGTQTLVVDRETFEPIQQAETDPWFQWHFGNGFVDPDGNIVVDIARYKDFQTNRFLQEVPSGHPRTEAPSTLWRVVINPQTAVVKQSQQLSDRLCEFPTVSLNSVGQSARYTYLSAHSDQNPVTNVFDALACFDHANDTLLLNELGPQRYPSEPIFAPDPHRSGEGWVLSVIYDAQHHASEVWIFNQTLAGEPLCRIALPQVIPFGFHGTWRPN